MRSSYPNAGATAPNSYTQGTADAAAAATAAAGAMAGVGLDITDKKNDAARRLRKGECPTCGVKTHKVNFFGKRTALSIDGAVLYGQCLICHPIEGYTKRRPQHPPAIQHHPSQPQPMHQQQQMPPHMQQQQLQHGYPMSSQPQMQQQMPLSPIPQHHSIHQQQLQMPGPPMDNPLPPQHQLSHLQQQQMQPPPHHIEVQPPQPQPPSHQPSHQQQSSYPPTHLELGIHDDDNNTVVSGITMDLRLIQGARNWDPSQQVPEGYDSDEYDEEGMPEPPPVSRRPQASVGGDDPYAEGARPDPSEQLPGRLARNPSGSYARNGAPLFRNYGALGLHVAEQRKPPPRAVSPIQEQQQHQPPTPYGTEGPYGDQHGGDMYGGGGVNGIQQQPIAGNVPGLDADGYPISDGAYGWDRQADLLPPGGMDALFRNNAATGGGAGAPPQVAPPQKRASAVNQVGEIEFNPAAAVDTMPPPPPITSLEHQASQAGRGASSFGQHLRGMNANGRLQPPLEEDMGPMYAMDQEDHGPSYLMDDDEDIPAPVSNNNSHSNLRYNHAPAPSSGNNSNFGGSHPQHGSNSGGVGRETAASAFGLQTNGRGAPAPALLSRDVRGRPDDDIIQDPMSSMLAPGMDAPPPTSGLDRAYSRQIESDDMIAPPVLTAQVSRQITASQPPVGNVNSSYDNGNASVGPAPAPAEPPSPTRVKEMFRKLSDREDQSSSDNDDGNGGARMKEQTVKDIPAILHCLNNIQANGHLRERAFQALTEIIWKSGDKAKVMFANYKGLETLVSCMWNDMGDAKVQDAAALFLFALAASTDGSASSDVLSNEESVCDTLLFSLQSHPHVESIQLAGCGILSCLAAASANNKQISDGTLSGALTMVLNAMANHANSKGMQKAGLQALYSQCALSTNAESNKRALVETQLDRGGTGLSVIFRSIELLNNELISLEWAFKLCWCLTSSEDLARTLSATPDVLPLVIETCRRYLETPAAGVLVEASFGIVGNLAHLEPNRTAIHEANAVSLILEGMKFHRNMAGVSVEGCAALANLGVVPRIRHDMNSVGAVKSVVSSLQSFLDNADVVEEACRALVVMSIDSEDAKNLLTVPQVLATVSEASERHETNTSVQEMVSCLVASLAVGSNATTSASRCDIICQQGGIDIVVRALGSSKAEKVLEAATNAYRNLACQAEQSDRLLKGGAARKLVQAMASNENSIEIQMNACCSLWNLAFKSQERSRMPGSARDIVDSTGVKCIVKAMQSHMESGDLLELACGALWSLVDDSVDLKKEVVGNGAIDAVASSVLMHPSRTTTLEKACGVLSNVSMEGPLAEAIANAQGVSIVVEAMRNNGSSISLLEIGAVVLRNIVVQLPDYAEEASGAVSTIINAMKDHPKAVSFQREACSVLWVLAALSENCESKILALDGISVLMKSLEHNSDVPDVQEAALGAFNQLATSAQ